MPIPVFDFHLLNKHPGIPDNRPAAGRAFSPQVAVLFSIVGFKLGDDHNEGIAKKRHRDPAPD
jgi:hypothetical protein